MMDRSSTYRSPLESPHSFHADIETVAAVPFRQGSLSFTNAARLWLAATLGLPLDAGLVDPDLQLPVSRLPPWSPRRPVAFMNAVAYDNRNLNELRGAPLSTGTRDMHDGPFIQRCRRIVTDLATARGWQLAEDDIERYVSVIVSGVGQAEMSDAELVLTCSSYHDDHQLVEALVRPDHPQHHAAWEALRIYIRRVLAARDLQHLLADCALSIDDLLQDAISDVLRGITGFRYQSRLQTWIFTIVNHRLHRAKRSRATQKRGRHQLPLSLESAVESDEEVMAIDRSAKPEELILARVLEDLLRRTLARHNDRRVSLVYRLWAFEELSMREVGQRVRLSAARIHALVQQALAALREDAALRAWVNDPTAESHPEPPSCPK